MPTAAFISIWPTRLFLAIMITLLGAIGPPARGELEPATEPGAFPTEIARFFSRHCYECHGNGANEGEIALDSLMSAPFTNTARDTWKRVMQQLDLDLMPPPDHEPQPDSDVRRHWVETIDQKFFRVDCDQVRDPGRVTVRRLNRAEYRNTIRDLFSIEIDTSEFPSDNVGYGFDNIGDVLSTSPLLLEKYLSAAEKISSTVIYLGHPSALYHQRHNQKDLRATPSAAADFEPDHILINRNGSVFFNSELYEPGEYVLRATTFGVQNSNGIAEMAFRVGDKVVASYEVPDERVPHEYETTIHAGGDGGIPLGRYQFHVAYTNDTNGEGGDRDLGVMTFELEGPLHLSPDELPLPPSHRRIIDVVPNEARDVAAAARHNLLQLAEPMFRRPIVASELDRYVTLVATHVEAGESFATAMSYGLQALLTSPQFLFRVERQPHPDDPAELSKLSQYELATRLSYFLWSSVPDEALRQDAAAGVLSDPTRLSHHVQRMIDDRRSEAFVTHFAGQWFNLRNLEDTRPNRKLFPDFDDRLRQSMQQETTLLFESVLRRNDSIVQLLEADYTYVDERLAKHYGLADVEGESFRRVAIDKLPRRGILTHAGILTLTSDPSRTIPVKRGKWIMENILGTPPPAPPAGVPPLGPTAESNPDLTLRQQLELHRQDPRCIACHRVMDPIGLAFEHFDAVGKWRDTANDKPIDATGALPDGSTFQNAIDLISIVAARRDDFARHAARTMLTYALGRGLELYDECVIDEIVEQVRADDYRIHSLIQSIVHSEPFLMRRGDGGQP